MDDISGKPLLPENGPHHDKQKTESGESSLDRRDSGRGRSISCEDENLQNEQDYRTSPDLNSETKNSLFSDDHNNFEHSQQLSLRCPTCDRVFSHREMETKAAESANIKGLVSVSSNSDRSNFKLKKQDHVDDSYSTMNPESLVYSIEKSRNLNNTSANSIGSPATSVQSSDLSNEENFQINNLVTNISQNSHALSQCKSSSFPHSVTQHGLRESYSDSSHSKVALQNGFRSPISTSLPETPVFLSSVAALPISLKNLVPRNVMDNLSREVVRDKSKIKQLEKENFELKKVNSDIPLLGTQADFWKQKFESSQRVQENLRETIHSERAIFQRKLNEYEERIKDLREENDFLHDAPRVYGDQLDLASVNIRSEISSSLRYQRQNDSMQDETGQTEVKQICSESTSTDDFPE